MTLVVLILCAILLVVLITVIIVLTVKLSKFLDETTLTVTSVRGLIDLSKQELEPAYKSINTILATVKNVSNATNSQLLMVKKVLTTILGASWMAFGKVKGKGGFLSGLISGFNIFRKKGDKKCQ